MSREYNLHERIHDVAWMICHANNLIEWAKIQKDSSLLIYACLEYRNVLERYEYMTIMASVSKEEYAEILDLSKGQRGIQKANKKAFHALNLKYQSFYRAVCEVDKLPGEFFDYKKSYELKERLSQYIHIYYRFEEDFIFGSEFMNDGLSLLNEVFLFVDKALLGDGETYTHMNLHFDSMLDEDKLLLEWWKKDVTNNFEELKSKILENCIKRGDIDPITGENTSPPVFRKGGL